MKLQGKVAMVTGGAQGIGRAMVESLLQEGAIVAICDCNKEVAEAVVAELNEKYGRRTIFLPCDVLNNEKFEDCFKGVLGRYKRLDILCNNAGSADEKEQGWRRILDLNIKSVILGTHLGFKYMSKENGHNGGVIVNTASISSLHPFPSIPIYSATKAAVNQFTRSIGSDLYYKKSGVKVLAINPGMTETPLATSAYQNVIVQEPAIIENFNQQFYSFPMQQAENVGRGLIEMLEKGENGSLWLVDDNKPAVLVHPQ